MKTAIRDVDIGSTIVGREKLEMLVCASNQDKGRPLNFLETGESDSYKILTLLKTAEQIHLPAWELNRIANNLTNLDLLRS